MGSVLRQRREEKESRDDEDGSEAKKSHSSTRKLDEFCEEGSISGVKFFHSAYPVWFRCAWVMFMILFLSMMIYQLYDLFSQFNENPLSLDVKLDHEKEVRLPNLLLCPHSQMRMSKAFDAGALELSNWARENADRPRVQVPDFFAHSKKLEAAITSMESMVGQLKSYAAGNCTVDALVERLASASAEVTAFVPLFPDLPIVTTSLAAIAEAWVEMGRKTEHRSRVKCDELALNMQTFQGEGRASVQTEETLVFLRRFLGLQNTSAEQFFAKTTLGKEEFIVRCRYRDERPLDCRSWVSGVSTVLGHCFYFNSSAFNVSRAGIDGAVTLELSTATEDQAFPADKGLSISLLADDEIAYPQNPVELNPGYTVLLPVRYFEDSYHSSVCSTEKLRTVDDYSQFTCMLERFVDIVGEECNCRPFGAPAAACSVTAELSCVSRLRENSSLLWDSSRCPVACVVRGFTATQSYSTNDAEKNWRLADAAWRERTTVGLEHFYNLSGNGLVAAANGFNDSQAFTQAYKTKIFYEIFYPLRQFVEMHLVKALTFHGPQFSLYPIVDIMRLEDMDGNASFPLSSLRYESPAFLKRNVTLYYVLNTLASLSRPNTKMGPDDASLVYTSNQLSMDTGLDGFVAYFRTGVREALSELAAEGAADELGSQLLDRADAYAACATVCASNGTLSPCEACLPQFDALTAAANIIYMIRDNSKIIEDYENELRRMMDDAATFIEGAGRTYQRDFLGEPDYSKFHMHSELEHAKYLIRHWPTWKSFLNLIQVRVQSVAKKLEFTTLPQTELGAYERFQEFANLTIPSASAGYLSLNGAAEHYLVLWKEALLAATVTKPEYLATVEELLERAQDYAEMSNVGPTYFRTNVMSVTVYVAEMRVRRQEQRLTYDFWTMLSDVGGTISFYIGGTIITIFEIVFWCSDIHKRRKLHILHRKTVNRMNVPIQKHATLAKLAKNADIIQPKSNITVIGVPTKEEPDSYRPNSTFDAIQVAEQ